MASTRSGYDPCYYKHELDQSTKQMNYWMCPDRYVNCAHDSLQPTPKRSDYRSIVEIESALQGLDRSLINCDEYQFPMCGPNGCLLPNDKRIPPFNNPLLGSRGRPGDKAVVTTNLPIFTHPGYSLPSIEKCEFNDYGYYQ